MQHNFIQFLAIFGGGLLSPAATQAQLVLDGSLGQAETLMGPEYQIGAELGQQQGGNLFHSFQDFNLQSHETATFSGPDTVHNIINRVTGGTPSNIDGLIRSTIPNADFYLLNPYGILFGPSAKLDVQGSFHVSTADYLRLDDGGRFEARYPNNSLLTSAPVAAFGFLTDMPATVITQNTTLIVPPMKSLSFIGGNLQFQGSSPIQFDNLNIYATFAYSLFHTAGGQLNLVAVGSSGEVLMNDNLTLTGQGGEIHLDHTLMDTSGPGSGNFKIRGVGLFMSDSTLQANSLGDIDGGLMDIQLTESLRASSELYYFNAFINAAMGRGQGGPITVKVPELTLHRAHLRTGTMTAANAGNIDLNLTRLTLLEGAGITANSIRGSGKGGQLTVKATESVLVAGRSVGSHPFEGILLTDFPSLIDNTNFSTADDSLGSGDIHLTTQRLDIVGGQIASSTLGTGNAGNLVIQADNVNITEGGTIATSALATGSAGNIRLDVKDTLFLSGRRDGTFVTPVGNLQFENPQSNIISFSLSGTGGQIDLVAKTIHLTEDAAISASSLGLGEKANNINLQAEIVLLTAGGTISNSNGFYGGTAFFTGNGNGGDIRIQAKQLTLNGQDQDQQATGIFSDTINQGQGGNLFVQTDFLDISNNAALAANSLNTGNAGKIHLQTRHLHLSQHGSISTAAIHAGGGNIIFNSLSGLLYLDNSEITTSVASGAGNGGNITIDNPQFMILNSGQIVAQADVGHGGNIRIVTDHLLTTLDSLINASSRLGIDGQVDITSPDINISNGLLGLSNQLRPANLTFKNTCGVKSWEEFLNLSTFFVHSLAGRSWSPFDLQPSFIK